MQMLIWLEAVAVLLGLSAAFLKPAFAERFWRRLERRLERASRRRVAAVVAVGLFSFAVSAALSTVRWPLPRVQDEFSYLLAADTFARGRLTNPTPPLARHFDSKHILVEPTYQSKYPPAQGLFLAVGQVVAGRAIVGVWLSMALACSAVCWMLQAWAPARWALIGGLLPTLHFGVLNEWFRGRFFYWSQSFWGGAVAMLGAALVFGGLRRLVREPRARDAALLGLGLVVLANSRPYEGLIASLPAGLALFAWGVFGKRMGPLRWLRRVAPALVGVLALGGAGLGYYQYRVTGSPFRMPYRVHEQTSGIRSHFMWPKLLDEAADDGDEDESERVDRKPAKPSWVAWEYPRRFQWLWSFYLGPALCVPLLTLPWARRNRWVLFSLVTLAGVLAANLVTVAGFPHYYAPVAPLVIFLVVQGLRRLGRLRRGRLRRGKAAPGLLLARAVVATVAASFLLGVASHVYQARFVTHRPIWSQFRVAILERLRDQGGKHLVFVRSPPRRRGRNDEWVYNGASIEAQKVVWARELEPAANEELLSYFRDRTAWLLEANTRKVRFGPYPGSPPP